MHISGMLLLSIRKVHLKLIVFHSVAIFFTYYKTTKTDEISTGKILKGYYMVIS